MNFVVSGFYFGSSVFKVFLYDSNRSNVIRALYVFRPRSTCLGQRRSSIGCCYCLLCGLHVRDKEVKEDWRQDQTLWQIII